MEFLAGFHADTVINDYLRHCTWLHGLVSCHSSDLGLQGLQATVPVMDVGR
jgi:hypothetical protein